MTHTTTCRDCGAPIVLVQVIPGLLTKGSKRRRIPLDPGLDDRGLYDPASGIAPSHALSPGRNRCRPITKAEPLDPAHEHPALTHYATCPRRVARTHPASTATEGTP